MSKQGVSFTVHVDVHECDHYWRATVRNFPVIAYGATAEEAVQAARDGLDTLFNYHRETPRTLAQYLAYRGVEHNEKEIETESVVLIPPPQRSYEMEMEKALLHA